VTVVLLVAPAVVLDLALEGDGPLRLAEGAQVVHASVVETPCQLLAQPGGEGTGLDLQLGRQRLGMQRAPGGALVFCDPVIDQPPAQGMGVDVLAERRVVRLGHQQGQTEAVQDPLDGPAPGGLLLAHLEQLADEGQLGFLQAQGRGDVGAQLQHDTVRSRRAGAPGPRSRGGWR